MADEPKGMEEVMQLAREVGELKAALERFEAGAKEQAKPLEAAALALKAAVDGLTALQNNELANTLESLAARVKALEDAR